MAQRDYIDGYGYGLWVLGDIALAAGGYLGLGKGI